MQVENVLYSHRYKAVSSLHVVEYSDPHLALQTRPQQQLLIRPGEPGDKIPY